MGSRKRIAEVKSGERARNYFVGARYVPRALKKLAADLPGSLVKPSRPRRSCHHRTLRLRLPAYGDTNDDRGTYLSLPHVSPRRRGQLRRQTCRGHEPSQAPPRPPPQARSALETTRRRTRGRATLRETEVGGDGALERSEGLTKVGDNDQGKYTCPS